MWDIIRLKLFLMHMSGCDVKFVAYNSIKDESPNISYNSDFQLCQIS